MKKAIDLTFVSNGPQRTMTADDRCKHAERLLDMLYDPLNRQKKVFVVYSVQELVVFLPRLMWDVAGKRKPWSNP